MANLFVGQTAEVKVESYNKAGVLVPTPADATFSYSVSDTALGEILVDDTGKATFTALAEGTATVSVTMLSGDKAFNATSEDIVITVAPPDLDVDSIKVVIVV